VALVLFAIAVGLILLILGLVVKALKWLIIIAIVVWAVGAVRGLRARHSSSRT
jgi:hypothetical protein